MFQQGGTPERRRVEWQRVLLFIYEEVPVLLASVAGQSWSLGLRSGRVGKAKHLLRVFHVPTQEKTIEKI